MNYDETLLRIKSLIAKLNLACEAYYDKDQDIISDFEYDKLYDELVRLEQESGIIFENSPTHKIHSFTNNYKDNISHNTFQKVQHSTKVLSLNKTKSIDELKKFIGNKCALLSYKLDGITIVLEYDHGNLLKVLTRGNGDVGEDVTRNIKVFNNIPVKISHSDRLTIRGEAVVSYDTFSKIREKSIYVYKSPRNLSSAIIRNLQTSEKLYKKINFIAFEVIATKLFEYKSDKLDWIKKFGFNVVRYKLTTLKQLESDVSVFKNNINSYEYPSDGLVLTFNETNLNLGETNKFPRDALAFKWQDQLYETNFIKIEWNVSRTGLINPVAVFDTVVIDNANINKATLHNINIVEKLKLMSGDKIKVYKANMIIPQIAENISLKNKNIARIYESFIPTKCPKCDSNTKIIEKDTSKFLFCSNQNCPARIVMTIAHFASRDAMNINGLAEGIIEKLVKHKYIKNYCDIYYLNQYEQEIKYYNILDSSEPNKNHKRYDKLIAAIELSKQNVFLYNFIYALGINHVGLSTAKTLCKAFNYDIYKIINAKSSELNDIEKLGKEISLNIREYFDDKNNMQILNQLLAFINFKTPKQYKINNHHDSNAKLNKLNFAITGNLNRFKNRKEIIDLIESLGGNVFDNISKKINYLINNDFLSSSDKNVKAKMLNIIIISEEEFINKFCINITK
jgi:DNA ligase (NAD+)